MHHSLLLTYYILYLNTLTFSLKYITHTPIHTYMASFQIEFTSPKLLYTSMQLAKFLLTLSGLFHRVIAQSGVANAMWASHQDRRSYRDQAHQVANATYCLRKTMHDSIECIMGKEAVLFEEDQLCKVFIIIISGEKTYKRFLEDILFLYNNSFVKIIYYI